MLYMYIMRQNRYDLVVWNLFDYCPHDVCHEIAIICTQDL